MSVSETFRLEVVFLSFYSVPVLLSVFPKPIVSRLLVFSASVVVCASETCCVEVANSVLVLL